MIDWIHAWPSAVAAFLASLVEFVEALTVVLVVGAIRGWRGALTGSGAALCGLLLIVIVVGPALTRIPLHLIQIGVGTLLLLFGMRWLRKAVLRAAGVIALHDENITYEKEAAALRGAVQGKGTHGEGRWDIVAITTAFKITMLEGIEVVFIVIAVGAEGTDLLVPASAGALAALLIVVGLGAAIHKPLSSIPENTLKFIVGVLLSAFGTFWVGEGMGLGWPCADGAIPGLILGYLAIAILNVIWCRGRAGSKNAILGG